MAVVGSFLVKSGSRVHPLPRILSCEGGLLVVVTPCPGSIHRSVFSRAFSSIHLGYICCRVLIVHSHNCSYKSSALHRRIQMAPAGIHETSRKSYYCYMHSRYMMVVEWYNSLNNKYFLVCRMLRTSVVRHTSTLSRDCL
jgi:hypothetical protein